MAETKPEIEMINTDILVIGGGSAGSSLECILPKPALTRRRSLKNWRDTILSTRATVTKKI